jgi:hypothetical protein
VAQGEGPEFKLQCCKTKQTDKKSRVTKSVLTVFCELGVMSYRNRKMEREHRKDWESVVVGVWQVSCLSTV